MSTIAKRLELSWRTAQKYVEKWPATQAALEEEKEAVSDLAESAIIKSIQNGNTQDAKWYLSKKAKDRGFADRIEVEGRNETVITVFEIPDNGRLTESADGKD